MNASDFDGTMYFHEVKSHTDSFWPQDLEAIRRFQAKGGLFGICTGRPLEYVTRFTDPVGIQFDFYIATTGAVILDRDKHPIQEFFIDHRDLERLYETYQHYPVMIHTGHTLTHNGVAKGKSYDAPIFTDVKSLRNRLIEGISIQFQEAEEARRCTEYIRENFDGLAAFQNIKSVDVVADGCSKGKGIEIVKKHFQVDRFAGIGDSFNDIPLLQEADTAYTFHRSRDIWEYADVLVDDLAEALEDFSDNKRH